MQVHDNVGIPGELLRLLGQRHRGPVGPTAVADVASGAVPSIGG